MAVALALAEAAEAGGQLEVQEVQPRLVLLLRRVGRLAAAAETAPQQALTQISLGRQRAHALEH